MLNKAPQRVDVILGAGGYMTKFSLAGEGTKVSMHSLRTLFVLII